MSEQPVLIEARRVGKKFKLYSNPNHRLLEWLSFGRSVRHCDFWALKDIDITLRRGECLGVIGPNGSGKSTLLKILSGSLSPTVGRVRTEGRVYALIELATGFNRLLTGRQNIDLAGQMLGLDPQYVKERTDDIIRFADLGAFIDQPVRHYSSGMFARLGFSLFAFLEPDVLMIDEVLAVGDAAFRRKCFDLMEKQVKSLDRAVVYVSHGMQSVVRLCSKVLWLDRSVARMFGEPNEVVNAYLEHAGEPQLPNRAIVGEPAAQATAQPGANEAAVETSEASIPSSSSSTILPAAPIAEIPHPSSPSGWRPVGQSHRGRLCPRTFYHLLCHSRSPTRTTTEIHPSALRQEWCRDRCL